MINIYIYIYICIGNRDAFKAFFSRANTNRVELSREKFCRAVGECLQLWRDCLVW